MTRRRSRLTLSAESAQQALSFLVHEGKLATNEVQKALKRREKLVREVRKRLAELGADGLEFAENVASTTKTRLRRAEKASRPARKRARRAISAATRKAYQAQGRYMAALRPLSKAARLKIKAIRKASGVDAAIAAAKKLYA